MKVLIILVVIVALSAVIGAVIVGKSSFEGIVVEKPYEQGLLWDREQHKRMNSGLNIEILNKTFRVGENELLIRLVDKDRRPVKAGDVSVLVSRPSTTTCDRRYNAMSSPDNLYRSSVRLPLYGHWDVKVQVALGQNTVTFESKIFAEK